MCVCVCVCDQLLSDSLQPHGLDCSPPDSSVLGMSEARILEWVAISSPRVSSQPRHQIHISSVSCISRQVLYQLCHLGSLKSCKKMFMMKKKIFESLQIRKFLLQIQDWLSDNHRFGREDVWLHGVEGAGAHTHTFHVEA